MSLLRRLPSIVSSTSRCLRYPVVTTGPRFLSTSIVLPPDIEFSELNKKIETDEITLIDVRSPQELTDDGMIPTSKHIELRYLGPDILISEDEFVEKYGFKKPPLEEPLIITCLLGLRARTAQLAMMAVGYKDVRVYAGSFKDWLKQGGRVVYPEPETEA